MSGTKLSGWSNVLQETVVALVLAMMVVVLFIATPLDVRSYGTVAIVSEAFAAVLILAVIFRRNLDFKRESVAKFFKTGANVPILIFAAVIGVSLASSTHFLFSVQEVLRIGTGMVVYFVMVYQFRRSEQITKVVDLIVVIAMVTSFISFAQYGAAPTSTGFATGLFSDHQLLGSFLLLLLPFVAVAAMMERTSNRQLVAQISVVVTVVALLISQARSAWIGTAVGIAVLAVVSFWSAARRSEAARSKQQMVMPVMLLVVSLGFFALVSPEAGNIGERMRTTINPSSETAVEYRQKLAAGAIAMIKQRPLTGQGIGLYPLYQQQFTGSGLKVWLFHDKNGNYGHHGLGETAHNLYLQTAAELGIPGLLAFVAIPLSFVICGLVRLRTMDAGVRRNVLMASICAIIAFSVDAAASPSWQYPQVSMFMWLVLGLGVSMLRPRHRRYSLHREMEEMQRLDAPTFSRNILRLGTACAAVVVVLLAMQSAVYAGGGGYITPKSADIEPKKATIFTFDSQSYTLTVTFSDNSIVDETNNADTTFSMTTPFLGSLTGNTYNASGSPETVGILGSFTAATITVSNGTTLTVSP